MSDAGTLFSQHLCAPYMSSGVVSFHKGRLYLHLGWLPSSVEEDAELRSALTIDLEPLPAIPKGAVASDLAASDNGHYVSVVTNVGVFVAIISKSIWAHINAYTALHTLEFLKEHYLVDCHVLQPLVFSGIHAISVMKQRWLVTKGGKTLLFVLDEENGIRIYEMKRLGHADFRNPVFRTDFNKLPGINYNNSRKAHPGTFFLSKNIVSFDFGPIVHKYKLANQNLITIFAVDCEGDVYSIAFDTEDFWSIGPVGPLPYKHRSNADKALGCDAVDLKTIKHPHSDDFAVVAISSSRGNVYHMVMVYDQMNIDDDFDMESCFNTHIAKDTYQLDVSRNNKNVVFYQDPGLNSKYIIRSHHAVYAMDIADWVTGFANVTEVPFKELAETLVSIDKLDAPKLSQVALILPDETGMSNSDRFLSTFLVRLSYHPDLGEEHELRPYAFIAKTSSGKVFTKFWNFMIVGPQFDYCSPPKEMVKEQLPIASVIDSKIRAYRDDVPSVPTLICEDLSGDQASKVVPIVSCRLQDLSGTLHSYYEAYKKSIDSVTGEISAMQEAGDIYEFMKRTFGEVLDLRFKVYSANIRIKVLQSRMKKVIELTGRKAINHPLTPAEIVMFNTLREYHSLLRDINSTIPAIRNSIYSFKKNYVEFLERETTTPIAAILAESFYQNFILNYQMGRSNRRADRLMIQLDAAEKLKKEEDEGKSGPGAVGQENLNGESSC